MASNIERRKDSSPPGVVYTTYKRTLRLHRESSELYDRWNLRIANPNRAASKNVARIDIDLSALRSARVSTHWCLGRPRGRGPRWYDPRTASSASVRACPEASASPGTAKSRERHAWDRVRARERACTREYANIACARAVGPLYALWWCGPRARV